MIHLSRKLILGALALSIIASCSCSDEDAPAPVPEPCAEGETLCGETCVSLGDDPAHCGGCDLACGAEEHCVEGACQAICGADQKRCGGACVSLSKNNEHCGACGNRCGEDEFCVDGVCGSACDGGREICGDECVDPQSDVEHCGGCGEGCEGGPNTAHPACLGGSCHFGCMTGFEDCDGDPANGCETETLEDAENCGACGVTCRDDQECVIGICACPEGTRDCGDGVCVDLDSDVDNCGACGESCYDLPNVSTASCQGGTCAFACAPSWGDCDGAPGCETFLDFNDLHCGACGEACDPEASCISGSCHCPVGPTVGECDGRCTSLLTDAAHCGACGNDCAAKPNVASASCDSGFCRPICQPGWGDCDSLSPGSCGTPLDTDENCGGCGIKCDADKQCNEGACICKEGLTCGGSCVDPRSDDLNCGACGQSCVDQPNATAGSCSEGACAFACQPGYMDCDPQAAGCETNILSDTQHCNGCNLACERSGEICEQGVCGCGALTDCGIACADLETDAAHCGACNNPCDPGQVCEEGACYDTPCGPDQERCGGVCRDIDEDAAHCGGCFNDCEDQAQVASATCEEGACAFVCEEGFSDCNDLASGCETAWSDQNCGDCGVVCGAEQSCDGGTCTCDDPALTACGDVCLDTDTDMENCGGCGKVCNGLSCGGGRCLGILAFPDTMGDSSCALMSFGKVSCWGKGWMVGVGAPPADSDKQIYPTPLPFFDQPGIDAVALSGGLHGQSTCALLSDSRAVCWGQGGNYELGTATLGTAASPVFLKDADGNDLANIAQIASTKDSRCALFKGPDSGKVKCWGMDSHGKLGRGEGLPMGDPKPEWVVSPDGQSHLNGIIHIAGGVHHMCALSATGEVYCWGNNSHGQLGNGQTSGGTYLDKNPTPVLVQGLGPDRPLQIAAGSSTTCALMESTGVKCWGRGVTGELGHGHRADSLTPVDVLSAEGSSAPLTGIEEVLAGGNDQQESFFCARTPHGEAFCWGNGTQGAIGNGESTDKRWPGPILYEDGASTHPLTGIERLSLGTGHGCASLVNGKVYCWGDNSHYQLGTSTSGSRSLYAIPAEFDR